MDHRTKWLILLLVGILLALVLICPSGFPYEASPTEAPQAFLWGTVPWL